MDCWKRQFIIRGKIAPLGGAVCSDVFTYLKKDRLTCDDTASADKRVQHDPFKNAECDLCDVNLTPDASGKGDKNHYLYTCCGVPGKPATPDSTREELLARIAAIGLRKRLGATDTITDTIVGVATDAPIAVETTSGSNETRLPRSDKEPPDKG